MGTRHRRPRRSKPKDQPRTAAELPSARRSQTICLTGCSTRAFCPATRSPPMSSLSMSSTSTSPTPFRAEFRYAPSQGLPVALSQYAPGKVVWIDNKEWTSGAIYAPVQKERFQAWRNNLLYFECQVCHYAKHVSYEEAERGEERDCPACGAAGEVRQGEELDAAARLRAPR